VYGPKPATREWAALHAGAHSADQIDFLHLVTDYAGYGKNLIKKFKMSPDAYAQMAIQLAYYRLKGTVRATYESAQTRKFLAGRTEARGAAVEGGGWCTTLKVSA